MYDDLSDHPFQAFREAEAYESNSERAWYAWVRKAEHLFGKSLDGDQLRDGYSLDRAYDYFANGDTPEQFLLDVESGEATSPGDYALAWGRRRILHLLEGFSAGA